MSNWSAAGFDLPMTLAFTVAPVAPLPRNSPPALYRNKTFGRAPVFQRGSDRTREPLHLCSLHHDYAHVGATGLQHHRRARQRLEDPSFAPLQSAAEVARLRPSCEAAVQCHEKFLRMGAIAANGFQNPGGEK